MSLSINVMAPSGELSRLTAGITGSSVDAITSIEVCWAEDPTCGAYLDTHSEAGQSAATMKAAFDHGGRPSAFPPIADYAFLSDCQTTALVAPNGNVEWLCLPRMDSPSVFGAILDRDAGGFRIAPAAVSVPAARRYIPGTNVLETTWGTRTGWCIVRDVLLVGPWHHERERSHTHRRSPTDYDAQHVLLRTLRCVNGQVEMHVDCNPVFDYGTRRAEWEYTSE